LFFVFLGAFRAGVGCFAPQCRGRAPACGGGGAGGEGVGRVATGAPLPSLDARVPPSR